MSDANRQRRTSERGIDHTIDVNGADTVRTAGVTTRLFDVSDLVALLIESESKKAA